MGKELDAIRLKEYLQNVVELESSVYTQESVIRNAKQKNKREVVNKQNVEKPVKQTIDKPVPPEDQRPLYKTGIKLFVFFLILGIIFLTIGVVTAASGESVGLAVFFIVVGAFVSIVSFAGLVSQAKKHKESGEEYNWYMAQYPEDLRKWEKQKNEIEDKYAEDMKQYQKDCDDAEAKYEREKATAIETYENGSRMVGQLEQSYFETKQVLDDYYALDVIFPKYRNFIAVSTFLEYLETGRCTELTGPNGCYNLFEAELRQNIIIGQLGTVIKQLEQIKQNQFVLYQEMQQANIKMSLMNAQLNNITNLSKQTALNTKITSYCAEITAKNTSLMTGMMLFG